MKGTLMRAAAALGALVLLMASSTGCGRRVQRLPDSAFRVEWTPPILPAKVAAGQKVKLMVGVKNLGDQAWPDARTADPARASGAYAVRLSYRFETKDGRPLGGFDTRADLGAPVDPGASMVVPIEVKMPTAPGDYVLRFDLVQELHAWFADKHAAPLALPVNIS